MPTASHDLTGRFVLILDDDADSREILERTITDTGGAVVAAASSREALNTLSECERLPDVIVTDIGMAEDDGYAFIRRLRLLPLAQGGAIPTIALTAYASPLDRAQALSAGFAAHFTKPFDPELLLNTIARIVSAETRASSSQTT
jgi:CheY-like chemotaxis protein